MKNCILLKLILNHDYRLFKCIQFIYYDVFFRPGQTDYLPTSSSGNRLFVPPGMIPQYTVKESK